MTTTYGIRQHGQLTTTDGTTGKPLLSVEEATAWADRKLGRAGGEVQIVKFTETVVGTYTVKLQGVLEPAA